MPSKISTVVLKQLKRTKPLLHSLDIEAMRKGQDILGALGARAVRNNIVYSSEAFENFEADWALPLYNADDGIILYLHGGSYTCGTLAYARAFGGLLADTMHRITLCVGYRLAPEHPFPAALDDSVAAYMRIRKKYPSQKIALVGESAGGGLCFALAVKLKELNVPGPCCIVALSPWTDLTCSEKSFDALADIDPFLSPDSLRRSAEYYCGGDAKNPLASPVFADLTGLPPALVYVGTLELLLDDSVNIAERYGRCGSLCELHIVDDMWHAYCLFGIPEAKDALRRIDEFICEHSFYL